MQFRAIRFLLVLISVANEPLVKSLQLRDEFVASSDDPDERETDVIKEPVQVDEAVERMVTIFGIKESDALKGEPVVLRATSDLSETQSVDEGMATKEAQNYIQDKLYTGAVLDKKVSELSTWREQVPAVEQTCPSMFIAVMSKRENFDRRAEVRAHWSNWSAWGGDTTAGFGICKRQVEEDSGVVDKQLKQENESFGDLFFLDCDEGYLGGLLTLKVIASMREYLEHSSHEMFMKTDDDTFMSPHRMCEILAPELAAEPQYVYAGVFSENGEKLGVQHPPCRDNESEWYEPESKFADEFYPISAKGGPGYILSRRVVEEIIAKQIIAANVLNNEDKAVGVWIRELLRTAAPVRLINLPGTDGYVRFHDNIKLVGKWSHYPYALHHHLEAKEIACLHKVDIGMDDDMHVDTCFTKDRHEKQKKRHDLAVQEWRLSLTRQHDDPNASTSFNTNHNLTKCQPSADNLW